MYATLKKAVFKKRNLFLFFSSLVIATIGLFSYQIYQNQQLATKQKQAKEVLGAIYNRPNIYISGGENGYAAGGVISLPSTDEPSVTVSGYNLSGNAEVELYESNDDALLDYLERDKDGNQIKKTPDSSKIKFVTKIQGETPGSEGSKVLLPISGNGIWLLKINVGNTSATAFIVRSTIQTVVREGDNEFIFWGQDLKTRRSAKDGQVIIYSMLNGRKELSRIQLDSDGIAKAPINSEADIALVATGDDRALVPINMHYLNTGYEGYRSFQPKGKNTKYFMFTDRPIYQPGDTVKFKAILRDDDDARYSIPVDTATVKISQYGDKIPSFQRTYQLTADGTLSGEYTIPESGKTGSYYLSVELPGRSQTYYWYDDYSSGSIGFQVEYFKKPEYTISVSTSQSEVIAGDKASFTITASYFSGQPLAGKTVKYIVRKSNFYEYSYLADRQYLEASLKDEFRYSGYGYYGYYGDNDNSGKTVTLDKNGKAVVTVETGHDSAETSSQIYTLEATLDDKSQEPAVDRRNVLVYGGEFGIYRKDYSYGAKVNSPVSIPITLVANGKGFNVSNVNLTVQADLANWKEVNVDNQKYPSYQKIEENLPDMTLKTDGSGNADINFVPQKTGSYSLIVSGKDKRGNYIQKKFYLYITSDDIPYYSNTNDMYLTVAPDKARYQPTDTVRLSINSVYADRDVFLTLERGRVDRYQVVRMNGKKATVDIPLINTDVPNMFATLSSFSNFGLDITSTALPVSTDGKKLLVKITPDSKKYGPGDTVHVDIQTTDTTGNPVQSELALWAVDKAIFELSDTNVGDIFKTFWSERYNSTQDSHSLEGITVLQGGGGGCFAPGTKILLADGRVKNIEDIRKGDIVLTKHKADDTDLVFAKVLNTFKANEPGYMIINRTLKITPDHLLWVNNSWKEASAIQKGDLLQGKEGKVVVASVEWQMMKTPVYNLEIEGYHTFFADGIFVHNQKGDSRSVFKDSAYWNPSIRTGSDGHAEVSFTLPDNLTTWTMAAVAATFDTRVGQTTEEIIATKDVITRPILPNIMRVGDELVISSLVQNFTDKDQTFDVGLTFDSGSVEKADREDLTIKSQETQQFYWRVKPQKENKAAKLVFSAKTTSDQKLADIVTQTIPVQAFGFFDKTAQTGEGNKTYTFAIEKDVDRKKSSAVLSLSSTILGTLPQAMAYLIQYPYGCVEQTTSRFVPAVIAKLNSAYFSESLKDRDINDIITKGVSKLSSQQQGDGGWTWWFSGDSEPFITAYVVEYLLQAKNAGIDVDENVLDRAKEYLLKKDYVNEDFKTVGYSRDDVVVKMYGLKLLGEKATASSLHNFKDISPDILAFAVMTNFANGEKDPNLNGLKLLQSMAVRSGDSIYWKEGTKVNFGSKDASTAFALRAILTAGGDRDLAVRAARYLTRSRRSDYWSNTFATAQVIRALTDYSKVNQESSPSYQYSVTSNGQTISQGTVASSVVTPKEITIPLDNSTDSMTISLTKTGNGQVYSTLIVNEFHTDPKAKLVNHGLQVDRTYENEKGKEYSLGVGEVAIVRLKVSGLEAEENYGAIIDELPSGMVPINERLNNSDYTSGSPRKYYSSWGVSDIEYTQNGAVLSVYRVASGTYSYSYRARVVSEGTFSAPPATASLMYAPEIYGRSDAETVTIASKSTFTPLPESLQPLTQGVVRNYGPILTFFSVLVVALFFLLRRNKALLVRIKEHFIRRKSPPDQEMPEDTPSKDVKEGPSPQ